MATVGGLKTKGEQSRRSSSIPRPTSKLTAFRTTPPHGGTMTTQSRRSIERGTPQTIVKSRTYSRVRRNSFISQQNVPPNSFNAQRAQPPQAMLSATTYNTVNASTDFSGIRPQVPVTNYSRRILANLDGMVSSTMTIEEDKPSETLPRSSRLTEANTSSPVTKTTSPVITQRQLMGPLGPPMPRSQTMGHLTTFFGSAEATPSPSKRSSRTVSTVSQRSEVGVMDALAETRMTDEDVHYFNQVAQEVEANRQRLKGRARATRMSSNSDGRSLASSRTLTSLKRVNDPPDHVTGGLTGSTSNNSDKKHPLEGTALKLISSSSPSTSPPVLTPDAGVSMATNSEKDWEINVKLVHFEEPVQYWRGRYSTLLDRLRSEDYNIVTPNFASTASSPGSQSPAMPNFDRSNSFEFDEIRRTRKALDELRDCCRTAAALKSFQIFEGGVLARLEEESAETQPIQFYTHSAASKARLIAAGLAPKVVGMDKTIGSATMKMTSKAPRSKPLMPRSKTMGEMGFITKSAVDSSTGGMNTKVGWRRPSYLKAQEEVLANEMQLSAERRARAIAAAQRNARRNGIGFGQVTSLDGTLTQGAMFPPVPKPVMRRSLPRKSSGSNGGTATNTEMLKRVFSESVRSVRRMGRSLTGMSGSGDA